MTHDEIYRTLAPIFSDVFLRDDIVLTPELNAGAVEGWDSFKQIEILISAEEAFGVKFSTRQIDALTNVGDLVELIALTLK